MITRFRSSVPHDLIVGSRSIVRDDLETHLIIHAPVVINSKDLTIIKTRLTVILDKRNLNYAIV